MKAVTVFVHDQNGNGLYGKKVKVTGDDEDYYTDSGGVVDLVVADGNIMITVGGAKVYSGYAYNLPKVLKCRG